MEKFEPTIESLRNYECPKWFRDAKFGIYCHWGPQCVPRAGDWYARNMYIQGHRQNKVHLKKYGHPSEVGYKDVIPQWKGENFDADKVIGFFKEIGARYTGPVAIHHDNFDLWDSKYQPKWNAVATGPKRDIVKLWKVAAEKHGLHFGTSTHLSRTYSWLQTNKGSDKIGKYAGVPYDGNNEEFKDLYLSKDEDNNRFAPKNPPKEWREHWINRIEDLIDNYHPEWLYFDAAVPFMGEDNGKSGMEVISHFYNDNLKQTNGVSNGFHTIKKVKKHGIFIDGISSIDYERKFLKEIDPNPWQTDDSVGDWFYVNGDRYKTPRRILEILISVVSMNGNLLLNVPLMPDGTMDDECTRILTEFGEWMKFNGEAIYETRPWKIAKEKHIYFTQKEEEKIVYAFVMKSSKFSSSVKIPCLGQDAFEKKIASVTLLKNKNALNFTQEGTKLSVNIPKEELKLLKRREIPVLQIKYE